MRGFDASTAFHISWSSRDNANAWVEPTTVCQLKCPFCFRGVGAKGYCPAHRPLEEVKHEIETLRKMRNIECVSLAGGEPLLYPQLLDVVRHCHKLRLKVRICSNGLALTAHRLKELRNAGTNEILIHLDRHQGVYTLDAMKKNRERYCKMFREIKGVNLGFMAMIRGFDKEELDDLTQFYKENVDVIRLASFIFTKDSLNPITIGKPRTADYTKLINYLNETYSSKPCAYISKKFTKDVPSWLIYMPIFADKEFAGYVDDKIYRLSANAYRIVNGRYWFLTDENTATFPRLLPLCFNKQIRTVVKNFIAHARKNSFRSRMHYQILTVNCGPDLLSKGWDLCTACPDAMLHNGKLVPSCLYERIKKGEEIVVP